MIEVVPAKPSHVNRLAKNMRSIDVLECHIMGHTPKQALRNGLLGSTVAWTVMIDGQPEAMMGATPVSFIEGRGRPWLLMSEIAAKKAVALVRLSRVYTEAMHRHYPILQNWIHADNEKTIRWLARLGYAVGSVDVIRGHPMRPFVRLKE
jgi:hypothetical protein